MAPIVPRNVVQSGDDFITLRTVEILDTVRALHGTRGQAIELLGSEQHELALAALGDVDWTAKRRFDDLAGAVAEIGQ